MRPARAAPPGGPPASRPPLAGELALSVLIVVVCAVAVWASRGWPAGARLFPLVFGVLVGVVALGNAIAAFALHRRGADAHSPEGVPADDEEPDTAAALSGVFAFLWILAFPIAGVVLGFVIAVPLLTLVFSRFAAREGWLSSSALALVMAGLVWFVSAVMGLRLPAGVFGG